MTLKQRYLWLLKNTLNRVTSLLARSRFGPFSLVCHVGRKSGRAYSTPLILARTSGGFVAELTYGQDVDWYRNVMAAGTCTVVYRGQEYEIVSIEACGTERGLAAFPAPARRVLTLLHRTEFRLLRTEARTIGKDR
jgi:deazaflavin-dependent oxidoreductase (nitroreductase family)